MPRFPSAALRPAAVLFGLGLLITIVACQNPRGASIESSIASPAKAETLRFAFWNVENLFDTEDDPHNRGDDEYLPAREWTNERYALKLNRLSEVIAAMDPHIIGFAEVENRRVLEDLFRTKRLAKHGYQIVHRDSPDKRGIDLALAYRAPFSAEDAEARLCTIDIPNPTRGVLSVPLTLKGRKLHVLVNHWPSRGGGEKAVGYRAKAAKTCRAEIARIVAATDEEQEPDILLVGDFNDDPFDDSVRKELQAVRSRNAALNRNNAFLLYNPSWKILGQTDLGTLYYNRDWQWNVFDQAIVSRGMLIDDGFRFVEGSLDVYAPDSMRDKYRRPKWFRKRGKKWFEGYSDHFPIVGQLYGPQESGDGG